MAGRRPYAAGSNPPPTSRGTFRDWLESQNKTRWTIKEIVNYAKKYGYILETGDASGLSVLSARNKHHAMTALANLAKYSGCYDSWLQIRQRYSLKWTSGNNYESLQSFSRFFNPGLTLESMLSKIKEMIRVLPAPMAAVVKYAALTGLRCGEAIESVKLINSNKETFSKYYDTQQTTLLHYKFPVFVRSTKKAYLSYITKESLSAIATLGSSTPTYTAIRLTVRRRGLNMEMHLTRKVFASWLHEYGIPDIEIDMLQGRCPKSVLAQHYIVPNASLRNTVLEAIDKLKQELEHTDR